MTASSTAMTSSTGMNTTRTLRGSLWRTSGIQFVAVFVVAYVIWGYQPQASSSADILALLSHRDATRILIAVIFAGLSVLNLFCFAASLRIKSAYEARLDERARIARELHDTLLQGFQAAFLKFHAVKYVLDKPVEARKMVESALEQAGIAIAEGRDAVQGLRSPTVLTNDLPRFLSLLGKQLAGEYSNGGRPEFSLTVEGTPRSLLSTLRDNVYGIAGEAVRNAFRHAEAHRIEVEVRYDRHQLRLRMRDDGRGIDPQVLTAGREGHYGLPGMQERAGVVGAKLAIWSDLGSGTEVELIIPAAIAYARASPSPTQ